MSCLNYLIWILVSMSKGNYLNSIFLSGFILQSNIFLNKLDDNQNIEHS